MSGFLTEGPGETGMRVLFIGDVYGRPGRKAVEKALPLLREEFAPDFVVANAENSAGGKGVTAKIAKQLLGMGCDVLTGGNHSLHQKDSDEAHAGELRLLRPANYPEGTPGRGHGVFETGTGEAVGVVNLCGRSFMQPFEDPFRMSERLIEEIHSQASVILVDFHAEATAEKIAMGWHLDGKVSAVLGTHTHVPTADETVLPGGTAYITDAGMTGPYHSIIGANREEVLDAMLSLRHRRFEVAPPVDVRICGVLVEIDSSSGKARRIDRVRKDLGDL